MAEMDIPRIKRNIGKMIDQGAPESDIDAYVSSEGATLDMLQAQSAPKAEERPGKLSRFLTNVYNNPPPSIAFIRDAIKGAPGAAMELTKAEDPEASAEAAGAMGRAALLASPIRPSGARVSPLIPGREAARPAMPAAAELVAPQVNAEKLAAARSANYKTAAESGAEVAAPAMRDTYSGVAAKLAETFQPSEAPVTFQVLRNAAARVTKRADDPLQAMTGAAREEPSAMTGMQIEEIQKQLRAIKGTERSPGDGAAAKQARAMIDEALANMADEAFIAGNPEVYRSAIAAGRGNTAAMYRMKGLEAATARGELGGDSARAISNAYKSVVRPPVSGGKSPGERMGLNPAELQAVRDVARPGMGQRIVDALGNAAPTDWAKGAAQVGGAYMSGGASLPLIPISYAAKSASDRAAANRAQRAMDVVASRSPLYRESLAKYQAAMKQAKQAAEAARREFVRELARRSSPALVGTNLPRER